MRVRVSPEAREDARDARRWLRENVSRARADRFELSMKRALQQMRDFPDSGSPGKAGTRTLYIANFDYALIYLVEAP